MYDTIKTILTSDAFKYMMSGNRFYIDKKTYILRKGTGTNCGVIYLKDLQENNFIISCSATGKEFYVIPCEDYLNKLHNEFPWEYEGEYASKLPNQEGYVDFGFGHKAANLSKYFIE